MPLSRPRFRHDLVATPIDVDGIAYVEVTDPRNNETFRFYDFEYKVALAFGGLPFDRVVPWVRLSAGLELSEDQLREFAEELARRGFLEEQDGPTPPPEFITTPPIVSPYGTLVVPRGGPLPFLPSAPPAPPEPVVETSQSNDEPILVGPREDDVIAGEVPDLAAWFPKEPLGDEVDLASLISGPIPAPISTDIDLSQLDLKQESNPPLPQVSEPIESPSFSASSTETPVAPKPEPMPAPPTEMPPVKAPPREIPPVEVPPVEVPKTPVATEASVILPSWLKPIQSPPAILTPTPVTFGPILTNPESPLRLASQRRRRSVTKYAALGALAGTLLVIVLLVFFFTKEERALPKMQAFRAELETIYRFYPTQSLLGVTPGKVLTLPTSGIITRIPAVGSRIVPGEAAVLTEKARPLVAQIAFFRERLAYHTQLKDSARQMGNTNEEKIQDRKITWRNSQIAKTQKALAALVPVPESGGEVEEVYVAVGDVVSRGAVVVRLRSTGLSARFDLAKPEIVRTRRNQNCYFWMNNKVRECTLKNDIGGDSFVIAEIPADKASADLLGKSVQLVRAVFHNAARIPPRAVVHGESSDRVWLVSPKGRVEPRSVTVGEIDEQEAIIVQGLDSGDLVVAVPHPALSAGALIAIDPPGRFPGKTP